MTTTDFSPPFAAAPSPSPGPARPYSRFPGFPRHIKREQGSRSGLARSMSSTKTRPRAFALSSARFESGEKARRRSSGTRGLPRTLRMTKPAWLPSRHRASASAASASSRTASAVTASAVTASAVTACSGSDVSTGNDSRLAASSAADHSRPSAGGTGAPGTSPIAAGGVFSTPRPAALRNRRVVGATTPSEFAISYAKYSDCAASLLAQNLTTATVSPSFAPPSNTQKNTAPPELMSTAPPPMLPSDDGPP